MHAREEGLTFSNKSSMIAAKVYSIGPASMVSSDVTVTRRIERRLAHRANRLQPFAGQFGRGAKQIADMKGLHLFYHTRLSCSTEIRDDRLRRLKFSNRSVWFCDSQRCAR
jgi:hypothetical protein